MRRTRAALGIAGIPLLSGCMMMGGIGHTGGMAGMYEPSHSESGKGATSLQSAETTNGGLTISLSFRVPTPGDVVTINARLFTDSGDLALNKGDVWLRVQTPGGSVDHLRMQSGHSIAGGAYQTQYGFSTPGVYVVTAEGQVGMGADVRTVSVTTRVTVGGDARGDGHRWLIPAAFIGSIGMAVMMALMMGSSTG